MYVHMLTPVCPCQYVDTHMTTPFCRINKSLMLFGYKDYIHSLIKYGDKNDLKFDIGTEFNMI